MASPTSVNGAKALKIFNIPDETLPDWSNVKGLFKDVEYREKGRSLYGNASYYGRFDAPNPSGNDRDSCDPVALHPERLFHPFKLQIASREGDLPLGVFVKITLLGKDNRPVLDAHGKEIILIAEVVDRGPSKDLTVENCKKTNAELISQGKKPTCRPRRFDLSQGMFKYFHDVSKGLVRVKVQTVTLDDAAKERIRAFTFYHKIRWPDLPKDENKKAKEIKRLNEDTECLNITRASDGSYVTESIGDRFIVGWDPSDHLNYMPFDPPDTATLLTKAYLVSSEDSRQSSENRAAERAREIRRFLEIKLGIHRTRIKRGRRDEGGILSYFSNVGPHTPSQTLYIYQELQESFGSFVPVTDELEGASTPEEREACKKFLHSCYVTLKK